MERERLDRLMLDPSQVQREDITDLKVMTERYPWFSAAHLLLAVGEHASGDVLFDEQLRTTAAHLPSRAVLFDRVHAEADEAPRSRLTVVPPTPQVVPEVAPIAPVEFERNVPGPPEVLEPVMAKAEEPAMMPPAIEEVRDVPLPLPAEISIATPEVALPWPVEAIEAVPEARSVEIAPVEDPEVIDPLDKQIRDAAMAGGYALVLEHTPIAPFEPPVVPAAPVPAATAVPSSQPKVPIASVPLPPFDGLRATTAPAPAPTGRMRFTDWLQVPEEAKADNGPVVPVPAPTAMPLPHRPAEGFPKAPLTQRDLAPATVPVPPPAATDTKSLIDRFIQQSNPAAPAKKAEFYTPQVAAKRSLEDHADLVSETLAKVYEAQGNYSKALAAYQRLALKHPDKSAYFAALSKAVEGKLSK